MSATITITLPPESLALIEKFRAYPDELPKAIKRGMDRALEIVKGRIQETRLTGKGPFPVSEHRLGQVSQQLWRTTRATPAVIEGNIVTGAIGSSVVYAAAHEFGFAGEVTVKSFTRKNPRGDILASFSSSSSRRKTATSKKIASGISKVKSHKRHMNIPERAPFRTGITENLDYIADEIGKELMETLKQ